MGAKGSVIAISDLLLSFTCGFAILLFIYRRKPLPNAFKLFTIAYVFLTLCYFLKFGWINPTSSFRVYLKVLTGVLVVLLLKERFFIYLERAIVILAYISLPFFLFQLIDYQSIKSFVGVVENNISFLNYRSGWYVNNIIFTINDNAMFRNSGFAWEPKGFANLLALGTIINLLINRFKINWSTIVMTIALLTTISTAGYVIFFSLLPIFIFQQKSNFNIVSFSLIILVLLPIFTLDFMYEKIIREFNNSENNLKYISAKTDQKTVSLGRFGSLELAFKDFPANPIIGIGMQDIERTQGENVRLVWVSGLADYLSRFGLVGIAFLLYSYSRSIKLILNRFGTRKGNYTIMLIFLFIFFASAVVIQPLFFGFQFYYLTKKRNEKIYSRSYSR